MPGPNLQLGVSAAGQETVAGLNVELRKLRENLTALKGAKADLSGLQSASESLKLFQAEFASTGQALRSAFTEINSVVRSGFSALAAETTAGGAAARGAIEQSRTQLQTEFDRSVAARQRFAQAEIEAVRLGGRRLVEADQQVAAARAAAAIAARSQPVAAPTVFAAVEDRSAQLAQLEADSARFVEARAAITVREEQTQLELAGRLLAGAAKVVEAIKTAAAMESAARAAWIVATEASTSQLVTAQNTAMRQEDEVRGTWTTRILAGARSMADARRRAAQIERGALSGASVAAAAAAAPEVTSPQVVVPPQTSGVLEALAAIRTSVSDGTLALRTAFAELAEAIRGGLVRVAAEADGGAKKVRSLVSAERAQLQAEYEKAIVDRRQFTQAELAVIRDAGVRLIEADRQMLAARAAATATNRVALGGGEFRNALPVPPPSIAPVSEIDVAYQQHERQMAQEAAAIRASEWTRAQYDAGAKIEAAQASSFKVWAAKEKELSAARVAEATALAKLERDGIAAAYANAAVPNSTRPASPLQPSDRTSTAPVFVARADTNFKAEADRVAAEKIAAWTQAETTVQKEIEAAQLQSARGFATIEKEAAATKLAAVAEADAAVSKGLQQNNTFVQAEEAKAAKQVASIRAAAQKTADELAAAAERIVRAEAAAQARIAQGQSVVPLQIRARAQLDAGVPQSVVQQNFGPTVTGAAEAASSLESLALAHRKVATEASSAAPKVVGLKDAMNDLHSASRGVASGFGAMFLTWGNIAPLLAGAALSHAFVETVKVGAEVNHQLALIKILAGESDEAVAGLNKQLLDMSSNGIFGPKELAEAFKNLTLAGLSISEQKAAIGDIVNFAIAGTTTIQQASESLVQISTAFGYSANGFGRVSDIIAKAAAISLSSVESLTRSMQSASEVHTLYGQSLVDVATNLATLSQLGIRGTAAGTALKNMYAELSGSTATVRRNLQAYNLDVLDEGGKVKALIPLLEELAGKYNTLKGAAQTRFIQDLSNTRGGKDLAALLIEYNKVQPSTTAQARIAEINKELPVVAGLAEQYKKLKTEKDKAAFTQNLQATSPGIAAALTEYMRLSESGRSALANARQQVSEAYGFSAVAAATLAVTAKSQMASVSASFQSALARSFDAIEPSIIALSGRLRGIFNSTEFQTSVQNLAVTVANVAVTLLNHIDLIKRVIEFYIAWKAITISMTVLGQGFIWLQTAAGWVGTLSTAFQANSAAVIANTAATRSNALAAEADTLAIQAEAIASRNSAAASEVRTIAQRTSTAAAEANTIATEANAVAAATSARAAGSAGALLLRSIPVIGAIAIAASFAMDLFWNSASGKKANVEDSFDEKARQVLEKLKQQTDLAKANWTAITGVGDNTRAEAQISGQEYLKSLQATVVERGNVLDAAKKKLDEQNAAFYEPIPGVVGEDAALAQIGRASTGEAEKAFAEAQTKYQSAIKLKNDMTYQLKQLDVYSSGLAKAADDQAAKRGKTGTGDTPGKPDLKGAGAELGSLLTIYHAQEAALKRHYDDLEKIETAQHQAGLISDIEYQIESEVNLEESYNKRLAMTQEFLAKSQTAMRVLEADPVKNFKAIAVQGTIQIDLTKQRDELTLAKALLEVKKEGAAFKQEQDISKFISQQMTELTVAKELFDTRHNLEGLTSDERAVAEARLAASSKFNDKIREQNRLLAETQIYLGKLQDDQEPGGDDTKIARTQAEVVRLEQNVLRLKETTATAGQFAAENLVDKLKPQWQLMLEGWRNVTEQMKLAYDEVVEGFITKGQTIFDRMLKTGKLTASELLDVIRDTLSKQVYEQTIAPVMASIGQKIAESIFGARGAGGAGGIFGSLFGSNRADGAGGMSLQEGAYPTSITDSPLDVAAQATAASLETLNSAGILPVTNAFGLLMEAAQQAANALFNVSGSGGGGFLGGLFGNNTGNGSAGFTGNTVGDTSGSIGDQIVTLFARGGAFMQPTYAFAQGGHFTNQVVSQRTPFKFAGGGAMGEMGEAGPEAVMPLKRGPDGSLGVQMHSGQQAAGPQVSVVIENHGDSKARVQQTQRGDGRQEIRVFIDAAMQEAVSQVHSGGPLGAAIENTYGTNRAAGLPRR